MRAAEIAVLFLSWGKARYHKSEVLTAEDAEESFKLGGKRSCHKGDVFHHRVHRVSRGKADSGDVKAVRANLTTVQPF